MTSWDKCLKAYKISKIRELPGGLESHKEFAMEPLEPQCNLILPAATSDASITLIPGSFPDLIAIFKSAVSCVIWSRGGTSETRAPCPSFSKEMHLWLGPPFLLEFADFQNVHNKSEPKTIPILMPGCAFQLTKPH
jgi:hypothetical protein